MIFFLIFQGSVSLLCLCRELCCSQANAGNECEKCDEEQWKIYDKSLQDITAKKQLKKENGR